MPSMHKRPLILPAHVLLFQHDQSVFVPLLDGPESFGGLLVLVQELLLVLLALVVLLLLLQFDEQRVAKELDWICTFF